MEACVEIKCKRIIDGRTYNTETATKIADSTRDEGAYEITESLYQNRFGAFFLYSSLLGSDGHDGETIVPRSPEEARAWLEERPDGADHIEALFDELPEAGSGETKFTLRIPDSLRDRLSALAKKNSQSLNAWIVRCLERCAAAPEQERRQ
jgi:hypothetical protein